MANLVDLIAGSEYFKPPAGTSDERPTSPESGDIRFNTDTNSIEYYNGTIWLDFPTHATAGIIQEDLLFLFDAAHEKCFHGTGSGSGTKLYNLAPRGPAGANLVNGPTYTSSNESSTFNFDGIDDRINFDFDITIPVLGFTVCFIFQPGSQTNSSGWNYWRVQTAGPGAHKYEFGAFGAEQRFRFKDNIDNNTALTTAEITTPTFLAFGVTDAGFSFMSVNGGTKQLSSSNAWSGGNDITFNAISSAYTANFNIKMLYSRELSQAEIERNYNAVKYRL